MTVRSWWSTTWTGWHSRLHEWRLRRHTRRRLLSSVGPPSLLRPWRGLTSARRRRSLLGCNWRRSISRLLRSLRRLRWLWSKYYFYLYWAEATKLRDFALGILSVNLDQTGDEELLLFARPSIPIVWLLYRDCETSVSSPLLVLRLFRSLGNRVRVRFDHRQVPHIPCFAHGECAIGVLAPFV